MPSSCKCIVKKLKYKGAITDFEYKKLMRNLSVEEAKYGEWELNKDGNWACPFCEFDPYHDNMKGMNYCPNCGAKLDRKETEDVEIH